MESLQECCCCVSPPPASLSSTDVTQVNGLKAPDRVPSVHDIMEWGSQRSGSTKVRKSSTSSVGRVHKKFSVLDSVDIDDSVFATEYTSTILVLYCGGTIGMRTQHGGTDYIKQIN